MLADEVQILYTYMRTYVCYNGPFLRELFFVSLDILGFEFLSRPMGFYLEILYFIFYLLYFFFL